MRAPKLRQIRAERSRFDGRFFEHHPDHWPIARAAAVFADREDWPDVAEYGLAFGSTDPPVSFSLASPRPPRRRRRDPEAPVARDRLYDAMISLRRVVPTRPRMWHDYLNALVWATFPRAKLALHRRQHAAIQRWLPEGAKQLPNARTRELDALALVDEGGILLLPERDGERRRIVFGHAIFEGLVLGQPAMVARVVTLRGEIADRAMEGESPTARADRLLAAMLDNPAEITRPEELARLPVDAPASATT